MRQTVAGCWSSGDTPGPGTAASSTAATELCTGRATTAWPPTNTSEGSETDGDFGGDTSALLVDTKFCESLPAETFSDSVGGSITDASFLGGGGLVGETSYDSASCTFKLDNDSEVVVSQFFDPESGSPTDTGLFEAFHEDSKSKDAFSSEA